MNEMLDRAAAAAAKDAGFLWEHMVEDEDQASDAAESREYWRRAMRAGLAAIRDLPREISDPLDEAIEIYTHMSAEGVWNNVIDEVIK
jgi:hypothetical protein